MATTQGTRTTVYSWLERMVEGANCASDTFICILIDASSPPSPTVEILADVSGELAGLGYARRTLTGVTSTQSGAKWILDSDPVNFHATGGDWAAYEYVVFDDSLPSDPVVCFGRLNYAVPGGLATCTDGNTLTINWDGDGFCVLEIV